MLSEEEKAINLIKQYREEIKNKDIKPIFILDTALNLIEKLQKENEVLKRALDKQSGDIGNYLVELQQKDKQIDLMAKAIDNYDTQLVINKFKDKEEIKEYFEKQAKEKGGY